MIPFAHWYESQLTPRPHTLDGGPLPSRAPRRWRKRQPAHRRAPDDRGAPFFFLFSSTGSVGLAVYLDDPQTSSVVHRHRHTAQCFFFKNFFFLHA